MTASSSTASTRPGRYPGRFRGDEARSARIGRVLKRIAGVRELDEALMHDIGLAFFERDELGAALAKAMRLRQGTPERVSRAEFTSALTQGSETVPSDKPALRAFVAHLEDTPPWVDWASVERGQRIYRRFGQNAGDVLLQLALIGGYRFGGPTELLVATGGLTGERALRRLAETQHWTLALSDPGALRPHAYAWRLTAQVRLMHEMVNETFLPRWDIERWGVPINQADQAATLGLFDGTVLLGVRVLGVPVSKRESADVMHMWRYVGWLMGVDERFLVDNERDRHRLNYHLLRAQDGYSEAGGQLTRALVAAQAQRAYARLPRLRGWYERERLLSMLTVFLGRESMRDFGLPLRPPWAHACAVLLNTWRYRTPWGRRGLDAWAAKLRDRQEREYFRGAAATIGQPEP